MDCASMGGNTVPDRECRCIAGSSPCKRYLATGVLPNRLDRADEDELLHVLVTKPEIAGKPRDNIVFEGDMDLKTTFETSYEALARMRLDCWRRHQELIGGGRDARSSCKCGCQHAKSKDAIEQPSCTTTTTIEEDDELAKQERAGNRQQVVSSSVDAEQLANEKHYVDGDYVDYATEVANNFGHPVCDGGSQHHLCSHQQQQQQQCSSSSSTKRVDAGVQVDLVVDQSPPTPQSLPTTTQPGTQQYLRQDNKYSCTKNYIDPDLTPIIVYDANMNRLERVGLRKRSKYRPSTSLRSGARGLFGDQDEREPRGQRLHHKVVANSEHQNCNGCQAQVAVGSASVKDSLLEQDQKMELENQQLSRPWDAQPTTKTELSLNARNLKDSKQKDYLMYSDANLPIDCKRKLTDNINMVDHIKEQRESNIADSNELNRVMASTSRLENQCESLEVSEEQRLAEQEEEAAVEELQRITKDSVNSSSQIVDDIASDDRNSHQSRLKRTCQNQNFDIHNNDYRETISSKTTIKPDERGTRLSPQSKFYTNLFRESPDFIMTTAKFLDQELQHERGHG